MRNYLKKKVLSNLKLSVIAFLAINLLIFPNPLMAQGNISLKLKDQKISGVMEKIEADSEYKFFYNSQLVDVSKQISLDIKNENIETVLSKMFGGSDIAYSIEGKDIILSVKTSQQQGAKKKVTGAIIDDFNEPVIGATVQIVGTTDGTMTDVNGNFTVNVILGQELEITYIGYHTQRIKVGSADSYNIKLVEDTKMLEEVVVVGYGVQKKSTLTGAISSVKAADLPASATSSVENMLSGKVAGMQIYGNDAQPGGGVTISIRGKGTVESSNAPLYVIDGFPISETSTDPSSGDRYSTGVSRSPLNSINPNDIASIEVLKDASATAIYGARAANGVILVTTKSGKMGKPKVSYDMKVGVQKMANDWTLMDASQWYGTRNRYDRERWMIKNKVSPYGNTDPNSLTGDDRFNPTYSDEQIANAGKGTDWVDEISQTGITNEHNISVSGATEAVNYLASLNYYNQKGILKNNNMERYSARLNLTQEIRKWVKVGLNATGSRVKFKNPTLGTGGSEAAGLLEAARVFSPDLPIRDTNGDFSIVPNSSTFPNPVSLLDITNRTKQDRILAQTFAEFKPIQELTLRVQAGIDKQNGDTQVYLPTTTEYGKRVGGDAYINKVNKLDKLLTLTASYTKTFAKRHSFTGLLGYEWQHIGEDGNSMRATNFPSDGSLTNSMGDGKERPVVGSYKKAHQIASYFTRVNYGFDDKYLVTFTMRADGSDKFGANNKWGYFPSAALAWRIEQEKFMENAKWISNAKLRFSVGQTGNSNIPGSAFGYYDFGGNRDYYFGGNLQAGANPSALGNPNLKWETTTEYNLGFDLGFINNRINLTLELYSRTVSDLIGKKELLYYVPGNEMFANIGETSSKGFDLNLGTVNLDGEFRWTSNVNLSAYRDKWKTRYPGTYLNPYQSTTDNLRVLWGYELDGILQPGEQLSYKGNYLPGSQKVVDRGRLDENGNIVLDPDGEITSADMIKLANEDPDLIVGFSNTFEYKNFDLNIHMYGFLGWRKYNPWLSSVRDMHNKIEAGYNYADVNFNKHWSSTNLDAKYPSVFNNQGEPGAAQYTLEKADFIRVRNITFGYTFAKVSPINKWFDQARVYVDVANPFMFTKFTQVDPEYTGRNDRSGSGGYPSSRSVTFGLNLTF